LCVNKGVMHHIYFENRSIITCSPAELPSEKKGSTFVKASEAPNLPELIDKFRFELACDELYLYDEQSEELFARFCSCFVEITAGGGAVRNGQDKYLMIRRRGLWDIPKGKLEEGEVIEECAVREVMEETGISHIELGAHITTTHHTYELDGKLCLKHTWWYRMYTDTDERLVPQTEEEIVEARWMSLEEINTTCTDSYLSIKEVISYLSR